MPCQPQAFDRSPTPWHKVLTMRSLRELMTRIRNGEAQAAYLEQTGQHDVDTETRRMLSLVSGFAKTADPDRDSCMLSAPGRTELAGNHTDHNRGRVLAAACSLDTLGVLSPRSDGVIRIHSAGYDQVISVDTQDRSMHPDEQGSSEALVRGVVAYFADRRYGVGGFEAAVHSTVLPGSGLSSSASFEVFVAAALNTLYNGSRVETIEIARAGQYAENTYFGKPCGLMDQIACAHGGIVAIDFATDTPTIDSVDTDFTAAGYTLYVIDTGGDHASLTDDYAAVPAEMKSVASALGHETLGDLDPGRFFSAIPELRNHCSDRELLRAMHFYQENDRVNEMLAALRDSDMNTYLSLVRESGISSAMLLQNYFSPRRPEKQAVSLACAHASDFMRRRACTGAVRVHGGGFAGTIQAYVPLTYAAEFRAHMESLFGPGSVIQLHIRSAGPLAFS